MKHAAPSGGRPLWLFSGTVAGPQSGGTIALHVASGNWKALQAMLGQPLDQTFTYDDSTIFLLWQGGVPTVIDAIAAEGRRPDHDPDPRTPRRHARPGRGHAGRTCRRPRACTSARGLTPTRLGCGPGGRGSRRAPPLRSQPASLSTHNEYPVRGAITARRARGRAPALPRFPAARTRRPGARSASGCSSRAGRTR